MTIEHRDSITAAVVNSTLAPPSPMDTFMESAIPASLAVAAAICFLDPSRFPALAFAFCALGFMFRDSLMPILITRQLAQSISESTVTTAEELLANPKRMDRLLTVGMDALRRFKGSKLPILVRTTIKGAIVESMQDQELERAMLATVTRAIVSASKDQSLSDALLFIAKQSLLHALRDKDFMKDSVESLVSAMLEAVQDPEMKKVLLRIINEAVTSALQDEEFVTMIRQVMKDVLSDGAMYRAGATGIIGAILPGRASSNTYGKQDSKGSTSFGKQDI